MSPVMLQKFFPLCGKWFRVDICKQIEILVNSTANTNEFRLHLQAKIGISGARFAQLIQLHVNWSKNQRQKGKHEATLPFVKRIAPKLLVFRYMQRGSFSIYLLACEY